MAGRTVTIQTGGGYVTQINQIEVAAADQARLLELMQAQVREVMSRMPGFLASSLHRGVDGTRVVNYVHWTTRELLDAAHAHPDFLRHLDGYKGLIVRGGPAVYEVAAVSAADARPAGG